MKNFETIRTEIKEHSLIIYLSREEKMNAFTLTMQQELVAALDEAEKNDEIKAIIFTGDGKAYCAGADLSSGGDTFDNRTGREKTNDVVRDSGGLLTLRFFKSKKPLIAAINGAAVGIGATMLLPMDVRICSENARFGFVFAKRGIVPEAASSWFLPRLIGITKALELCYSGKIIDATEANRIGLVNYVVEDDNLIDKAVEISDLFCNSTAPVSVAMTRHMLWSLSAEDNPENAHIIESKLINSRGASDDAKEGVMSFLEKRSANFKNTISSDLPNDFPWRESQFKEKE